MLPLFPLARCLFGVHHYCYCYYYICTPLCCDANACAHQNISLNSPAIIIITIVSLRVILVYKSKEEINYLLGSFFFASASACFFELRIYFSLVRYFFILRNVEKKRRENQLRTRMKCTHTQHESTYINNGLRLFDARTKRLHQMSTVSI